MPPMRQRPPTTTETNKQIDDAFGTDEEAAATLKRVMGDPARQQLMVLPPPQPSPLYAALAAFQAEVPAIPKSKTAKVVPKDKDKPSYSYKYADLADVTAIVLPLLGKLGLTWTCVPTWTTLPGETQPRFVMVYCLRHVLGETIEGFWPIPDRSDSQAIGAALTYARRYALCSVLGVAADEDTDGTAAKDAAVHRTETLDDASRLTLPPDEAEHIVAALEPAALTPLAEYPKLWQTVVARKAGDKDSPVEHDGVALTWGQLFGLSLAQRVDALRTPEQCRDFWTEAAAVEKSGAALPWTWEGIKSGARLKKHGDEINAVQARTADRLRKQVGDAITLEAIAAVREEINMAHEDWKIHGAVVNELYALADQRAENIKADEPPAPYTTNDATAYVESTKTEPGHPLGFGEAAQVLEYRIWRGAPTTTLLDDLAGALERGEIEEDEQRLLAGMLNGRPEPADEGEGLVPSLEWRIDTARGHDRLDQLAKEVAQLALKDRLTHGAADAQAELLYSRITARRGVQDGQRYGGTS